MHKLLRLILALLLLIGTPSVSLASQTSAERSILPDEVMKTTIGGSTGNSTYSDIEIIYPEAYSDMNDYYENVTNNYLIKVNVGISTSDDTPSEYIIKVDDSEIARGDFDEEDSSQLLTGEVPPEFNQSGEHIMTVCLGNDKYVIGCLSSATVQYRVQ